MPKLSEPMTQVNEVIEKGEFITFPGSPFELYLELVDAGVRYFTAVVPGDEETLRLLAEEVVPEVVRRAGRAGG